MPIELIDPGADPLGALAQPSDHELKVPYGIMLSSCPCSRENNFSEKIARGRTSSIGERATRPHPHPGVTETRGRLLLSNVDMDT